MPTSFSCLVLFSPPQTDPKNTIVEPMLDFNAGTCTAYLAQAQPSNFLLPGKPGGPSVGTTIGHSSARPLLAPREQAETVWRRGQRPAQGLWTYSPVCVPLCLLYASVCSRVCVFKYVNHRAHNARLCTCVCVYLGYVSLCPCSVQPVCVCLLCRPVHVVCLC